MPKVLPAVMIDYVLGGELFDMVTEDELEASIKEVITIKDAAPIPDIKHDLSAFYINVDENIYYILIG